MMALQICFWVSLAALGYIYFFYPTLVGLLARVFGKEPAREQILPSVTLVIAAYNEEDYIEAKLINSLELDYPRDKLTILVASDGSVDATNEIAQRFCDQGIRLRIFPQNIGKSAMLGRIVPELESDLIAFSDASSRLAPDALKLLVQNFADPAVGCVSGLYKMSADGDMRNQGEGLYWKYETWIKSQESRLSSMLGAHGAFYCIRREAYRDLESDVVNDDYVIAMRVVEQGYRSVYDQRAKCLERERASVKGELARRRRIAVGNCQQIVRLWRLLNPRYGWFAFCFFSHKVLRTLAPLFMIGVLVGSMGLPAPQSWTWLGLQGMFYSAGVVGYCFQQSGRRVALLSPVLYFCLGNAAMLGGILKFCSGRPIKWESAREDLSTAFARRETP